MLPATRIKAGAAGPLFDASFKANGSSASASVTAASGAWLVFATANGNGSSTQTATVDGSNAALVTSNASFGKVSLWKYGPVSAGSHTVAYSGVGNNSTIVGASYVGVTSIGTGANTSGSGTSRSVSPSGGPGLCVGAMNGAGAATATSGSTLRAQQSGSQSETMMAFVESASSPVGITSGTSGSYGAVGVWLS